VGGWDRVLAVRRLTGFSRGRAKKDGECREKGDG
jgi:hypothetical protein